MTQHIRTHVRDAVLAGVSGDLSRREVEAVEWAALEYTTAAIRAQDVSLRAGGLSTLVDWDEYRRAAL